MYIARWAKVSRAEGLKMGRQMRMQRVNLVTEFLSLTLSWAMIVCKVDDLDLNLHYMRKIKLY